MKNEADVIEAFVRHNLAFMDALAIVDNDSVDGTREILLELQQEGLPIILFDDPLAGHFHAEIMTDVYHRVVPKFKPRFAFLLDGDEFIVPSSREALYTQLRAMRPGTTAQYCWRGYVPSPSGPEGDPSDPLRSITHRKVFEHDPCWKVVMITNPKIDTKLKIIYGNHAVTHAGRLLRKVTLEDVVIAHFPVRSVDQITSKAVAGWIANLQRNRYVAGSFSNHWKTMYDRVLRGGVLTTEDATREALTYARYSGPELKWPKDVVREPVVPAYAELTVRPPINSTPLQKVVRSVDKIFHPENDFSGLTTGIEFLQDSTRKGRTWRDFVRPFARDNGAEKELYVDLPPFRYLAQRHSPASVLDIGCGSGAYLKYFASLGAKPAKGVDSSEQGARYLQPDEFVQADLAEPLDLAQTFDLVICVDAIQHIPEESERVLVGSIARHAGERIVFSGARAAQPGAGHINGRPISHWLDLFAAEGWYPSLFDSLTLRSLSTFPWFCGGLVVLTRDGQGADVARERLITLEQQESARGKQRPAVITHPFAEMATKLLAHPDSRALALTNAVQRALTRVYSIRADTGEVTILGKTRARRRKGAAADS